MIGKAFEIIPLDYVTPQALTGLDRISLRALWQALGVRRGFLRWVKQFQGRLTRNVDYGVLGKARPGGLETEDTDYWITVDKAKFIVQVGRTRKAQGVRSYLAECDQKLGSYRETIGAELPPWLSETCFQKASEDLKQAAEILDLAAAAARDCHALQATCRQLQDSIIAKDQLILDLKAQLGSREWLTIAEAKDLISGLANLPNSKLGSLLTLKSRKLGFVPMRVSAEGSKRGPRAFHRSVVESLGGDITSLRGEG